MKDVTFNADSNISVAVMPAVFNTQNGVEAEFGNTLRDNILQFELQNEVGSVLTVTNNSGVVTITMTSKSGKVLGTGTFNINEQDLNSIVDVTLDHDLRRLEFLRKNGNKFYCSLYKLYEEVDKEIARAKQAEQNLQTNLDTEITRAKTKEQQLDTKIQAETERSTTREQQLQQDINSEISRATQAEQELDNKKQNKLVAKDAIKLAQSGNTVDISVKYDNKSVKLNTNNELQLELYPNTEVEKNTQRLRSVQLVNQKYSLIQSRYLTADMDNSQFENVQDLTTGPWYFEGVIYPVLAGDTAIVKDSGSEHKNKQAQYVYDGSTWRFQHTIGHSYKMEENGNFIIQ